jgi:two-component system response regulator GlrR
MAMVLVVDDDRAIRNAIVRFLKRLGHEVTGVESADLATSQLAIAPYDVVITDLDMPGRSGLELAREIQTMPTPPRCILVSGGLRGVDVTLARELGVFRVLEKPCSLYAIGGAVGDSLALQR